MPKTRVGPAPLLGYETSSSGSSSKYYDEPIEDILMQLGEHGNYGYPSFPPNRDVGGTFQLQGKRISLGGPVVEAYKGASPSSTYKGQMVIRPNVPIVSSKFVQTGAPFGPEAFAKTKPTRPSFSGLNALVELKDLPGMLQQKMSGNGLKDIGNYYLALEFGWKPLLRDIRSMIDMQRKAQVRLNQLLRDNGRPVRRSVVLRSDSTTPSMSESQSYNYVRPILNTLYFPYSPKGRSITVETDKVWANARFRYWLPGGTRDVVWRRKMLARIYGLNPSPAVVYNAIPWSWLVDWFSNTGYLVENLDVGVADRLAADYCYVMRYKSAMNSTSATVTYRTTNGERTFHATSHAEVFVKSRLAADPFGWDVSQNSLSNMQLSILGALGLSRL